MKQFEEWEGFKGRIWKEEINTRDFIQENYTPYDGDESFLAGSTEATDKLWGILQGLQKEERKKGGVLDMDTDIVSSLTSHGPGYISEETKDLEQIVGLQTDKPLKRAFMPYGGIKMAEESCRNYGYEPSERLHEIFTKYSKTHNTAVFDAYTPEMKKLRNEEAMYIEYYKEVREFLEKNDLVPKKNGLSKNLFLEDKLHNDKMDILLE